MGTLRETTRRVKVDMVRNVIARSPYLTDRRVGEICGVGLSMVSRIRGEEFGLRGQGDHGEDVLMFSDQEMKRLDDWLWENHLLESW
jgi:hypothetical protein